MNSLLGNESLESFYKGNMAIAAFNANAFRFFFLLSSISTVYIPVGNSLRFTVDFIYKLISYLPAKIIASVQLNFCEALLIAYAIV